MSEHCLAWRRWADERDGFQPGKNWLLATPTGPHVMSCWAQGMADLHGARVYGVDFDPRWVSRQLRAVNVNLPLVTLTLADSQRRIVISFLSDSCFRLRFD